jgi:hypothetical protein
MTSRDPAGTRNEPDTLARALHECDAADDAQWDNLLHFEREHYRNVAVRLTQQLRERGFEIELRPVATERKA